MKVTSKRTELQKLFIIEGEGISLIDVAANSYRSLLTFALQLCDIATLNQTKRGLYVVETVVQIITMSRLLEYLSGLQHLNMDCFNDFGALFDSVSRDSV